MFRIVTAIAAIVTIAAGVLLGIAMKAGSLSATAGYTNTVEPLTASA